MINSSLDCLQAFSQNQNKNLDCDKNINDIKYKDNNFGINFNEIGNKSMSTNPLKNKSGLKLNMQYSSSSFEEDLGLKK